MEEDLYNYVMRRTQKMGHDATTDKKIDKISPLYSHEDIECFKNCCDNFKSSLEELDGWVIPHPSNILVARPSQCGKTCLVVDMIKMKDTLFDPPIERVIWCYSEWQDMMS